MLLLVAQRSLVTDRRGQGADTACTAIEAAHPREAGYGEYCAGLQTFVAIGDDQIDESQWSALTTTGAAPEYNVRMLPHLGFCPFDSHRHVNGIQLSRNTNDRVKFPPKP